MSLFFAIVRVFKNCINILIIIFRTKYANIDARLIIFPLMILFIFKKKNYLSLGKRQRSADTSSLNSLEFISGNLIKKIKASINFYELMSFSRVNIKSPKAFHSTI